MSYKIKIRTSQGVEELPGGDPESSVTSVNGKTGSVTIKGDGDNIVVTPVSGATGDITVQHTAPETGTNANFVKFDTDPNGHVNYSVPVTKADITGLGIAAAEDAVPLIVVDHNDTAHVSLSDYVLTFTTNLLPDTIPEGMMFKLKFINFPFPHGLESDNFNKLKINNDSNALLFSHCNNGSPVNWQNRKRMQIFIDPNGAFLVWFLKDTTNSYITSTHYIPDVPTVSDAMVYLINSYTGTEYGGFSLNQSWKASIGLPIPEKTSQLENDSGFITEAAIEVIQLTNELTDYVAMLPKAWPPETFDICYTNNGNFLDLASFKGALNPEWDEIFEPILENNPVDFTKETSDSFFVNEWEIPLSQDNWDELKEIGYDAVIVSCFVRTRNINYDVPAPTGGQQPTWRSHMSAEARTNLPDWGSDDNYAISKQYYTQWDDSCPDYWFNITAERIRAGCLVGPHGKGSYAEYPAKYEMQPPPPRSLACYLDDSRPSPKDWVIHYPHRISAFIHRKGCTFQNGCQPNINLVHEYGKNQERVNYENWIWLNDLPSPIINDVIVPMGRGNHAPGYFSKYVGETSGGYCDLIFVLRFLSTEDDSLKRYEITSPIYRCYVDGTHSISPLNK